MKCKFVAAHQFLLLQIIQSIHVVCIVDLNHEILALLKLVFNLDWRHKLWVQIVKDALSHANARPLITLDFP